MKGALITAVAALAVASTPALASAAPTDLTAGTGRVVDEFGTVDAHVNAHSYDGANPRGHFYLRFDYPDFPDFSFDERGDVTCHRVVGNVATVGGAFGEPLEFFGWSQGILVYIVDNGPTSPDTLLLQFEWMPPQICPPSEFPGARLTSGNFVVKDR